MALGSINTLLVVALAFQLKQLISGLELDASKIVLSVAIDGDSLEIQREGLRLLQSIVLFGGRLNSARKVVCVSLDKNHAVSDYLINGLEKLNVSEVYYSQRYSRPSHAPNLNKLCSFDPPDLQDDEYLLYMDADVFVVQDPLPLLSNLLPINDSEVLCGRPWNTFPNIQLFSSFVGEDVSTPFFFYDTLEVISIPGRTYYGMCNTGVYFMQAKAARRLLSMAYKYLLKAESVPLYRNTIPFAPNYTGIDSIILWAAQYALNFHVRILPAGLNYIAAAEEYQSRFLHRDPGIFAVVNNDPNELLEHCLPLAFIHFSRGSDLLFGTDSTTNTSCLVKMFLHNSSNSLIREVVGSLVTVEENCRRFESLLRPFEDTVIRTSSRANSNLQTSLVVEKREIVYRVVDVQSKGSERRCRSPVGDSYLGFCSDCCVLTLKAVPHITDADVNFFWIVFDVVIRCESNQCPAYRSSNLSFANGSVMISFDSGTSTAVSRLGGDGRFESFVHYNKLIPTGMALSKQQKEVASDQNLPVHMNITVWNNAEQMVSMFLLDVLVWG